MLINIVYYRFNDVNPSHIIVVDCCIHFLRGRGPVAAVRRRRPSLSIDARRDDPQCRKMPPTTPFSPPPSPPPPQITPTRNTWPAYAGQRSIRPRGRRAKQLPMLPRGVDVVHRRKRGTYPPNSYVENSRDTPQTSIDAS